MRTGIAVSAEIALILLNMGCSKPVNSGFRSHWEQEKANRAEFEGRTEDAKKHRERAEAEAQKHGDYENWKRANDK